MFRLPVIMSALACLGLQGCSSKTKDGETLVDINVNATPPPGQSLRGSKRAIVTETKHENDEEQILDPPSPLASSLLQMKAQPEEENLRRDEYEEEEEYQPASSEPPAPAQKPVPKRFKNKFADMFRPKKTKVKTASSSKVFGAAAN